MIHRIRIESFGRDASETARDLDLAASHVWQALIAEGLVGREMDRGETVIERIRHDDEDVAGGGGDAPRRHATAHFGSRATWEFPWRGRRIVRFDVPEYDVHRDDLWTPKKDVWGAGFGDESSPTYTVLLNVDPHQTRHKAPVDVTHAVFVIQRMLKPTPGEPWQDEIDAAFKALSPLDPAELRTETTG